MNHVISPWGYVAAASYTCDKCGSPMHDEHDRKSGIEIYACFKCGNRLYFDYPRRLGCNDVAFGKVEDLAA